MYGAFQNCEFLNFSLALTCFPTLGLACQWPRLRVKKSKFWAF